MAKVSLPENINYTIDERVFNQNVLDHLMEIYNYEAWYGGQSSGKCLKRGTKVVMYSGELKCVEDICIGDLLMGIDSTPRKVLSLSSGIDELYTVHQCHGMDYTVNSQHILSMKKAKSCRKTAHSKERYSSYGAYVDMPIQEYMKQSDRWKNRFYGYRVAVEFPKQDVIMNPYFLGAWLGDGHCHEVCLTTEDIEIVDFLRGYANSLNQPLVVVGKRGKAATYRIKGSNPWSEAYKAELFTRFRKLNLLRNKHIPDSFLYNTREVRLQVLAGLIDTDGNLQGNCYDIIQKSKLLSEQIQYLCHSLGLRCSMQECRKECCNNGVWGTYYRMCISGDTQLIPVKIERKKITSFSKARDTDISGISIEPIGKGEYFGFTLDGDHKFLLEDFTVTHNSWGICQRKLLHLTFLPMRNLMCLRTQSTDCFDSCWGQMITAMEQLKLEPFWEVRRSDHRLTNRLNGNSIYFDGVDKIENIKSFKPEKGNLTDVWYEEATEELLKSNITTIDGRLRDEFQKCSLIVSFNPVYRSHWLHDWIEVDLKGKDALIVQSTYKDNKFCSAELIKKTEDLQYTDPYRYQVYALGQWGVTGQTVFNSNKIAARLAKLKELHEENPPERIEFAFMRHDNGLPDKDSFSPFKHPDGETWIYEYPNSKHPYVLSIDTAGEGVDFFAGHVIDNINGKQVAVFHSERDPDVCVLQLFGLAKYYNNALVVPEINFDGSYLLNKFKELGYKNIYQRVKPGDTLSNGLEQKLGFRTTVENRSRILAELKDWSEEHMNCINDVATLNEMLTFTRQTKRQKGIWWGAEAGAHDDLCFVKGTLILTDRGQIPIEKINVGDMVLTREGFKPVEVTTQSFKTVITKLGLTGTPNHPIITTKGEIPLALVRDSDKIYMWNEKLKMIEVKEVWNAKQFLTTGKITTDTQNQSADNLEYISGDTTSGKNLHSHYTGKFGLTTLEKYPKDTLFTTRTKILSTTKLTTLNVLLFGNTAKTTCKAKNEEKLQEKTEKNNQNDLCEILLSGNWKIQNLPKTCMPKTEKRKQIELFPDCLNGVKKIRNLLNNSRKKMEERDLLQDGAKIEKVYNLQVFGTHEYFANNILAHNCMALAIALQGRDQQEFEEIPERKPLKGNLYPEELEMRLKNKEISWSDVFEYKKTHSFFGEKYVVKTKKGSRYGR